VQVAATLTGGTTTDRNHGKRSGSDRDTLIAFHARQDPISGEVMLPLEAKGGQSVATNRCNPQPGNPCHPLAAGAHAPAIAEAAAVRRLTPRECERLQGFPDDWTMVPLAPPAESPWRKLLTPFRARKLRWAKDGPRYKALGNSWAVPCVSWIGSRIQQFIDAQFAKDAA